MMFKNRSFLTLTAILGISAFILFLSFGTALAQEKKVKIADHGWDSGQVHARVAKFIVENGLGYQVELVVGDTNILMAGIRQGDVEVIMESWTENIQKAYDEGVAEGSIIDLGSNFPDSWQGFLVPTYVIKGDPERGIKPLAPDLKSVSDMPKYAKLFQDPEEPSKGRFYSCIPGWGCEKINREKIKTYGLDKTYNIFVPGSDAALLSSMVAAYKKGQPWFGYYWAPTWPLGKYDMTPLEEPPFDKEVWEKNKGCAYPSVQVNILVHSSLPKKAPEVVEFLKKYETTQEMANKVLSYMQDNKAKADKGAIWFLKNYESVWAKWIPEDVAKKVKAALPE
jgi:glycine betaine/proline transport system substrate-binding protein